MRKYDPELGRFTLPDPLWEKYNGWTPWQYSANNPISLFDINGKIIEFCGDREISFNDFKSCVPEKLIDRVSMASDGLLQINTDGYEIGSSKEFDAIININNVKEKFGYETVTQPLNYRQGAMFDNNSTTSTTSFWIGTEWDGIRGSRMPPIGFDGYVKINKDYGLKLNGVEYPRGIFIGHELLESFYRTINKQSYFEAHDKANETFFGGTDEIPFEAFDKTKETK